VGKEDASPVRPPAANCLLSEEGARNPETRFFALRPQGMGTTEET